MRKKYKTQTLNVSPMMRRKQSTLKLKQMKLEANRSDHHHCGTPHWRPQQHSPCL